MCRFKMIYNDDNGYAVQCNSCRHIHVGFGNNVLAFTFDQFKSFIRTVDEYQEAYKFCEPSDIKNIQIPTIARSIMLLYSLNELRLLSEFLHRTEKILLKEKLFVFHHN